MLPKRFEWGMAPTLRQARLGDYDSILENLSLAFADEGPDLPRFDLLYPDAIRRDAACMTDWLVAEIDGNVVAGIQIQGQPLLIAATIRLKTAGLGQVFCLPEFRRQGLMSSLLNMAIRKMEADAYQLCFLSGDRQRYWNYGWELAGSARRLRLSSRRIGSQPVRAFVSGEERIPEPSQGAGFGESPKRWLGEENSLGKMLAAHEGLPTRALRELQSFAPVLSRFGVAVWTMEEAGCFAYIALQEGRLAEYGGDPQPFQHLLAYLLEKAELRVDIPPHEASGLLEGILLSYAAYIELVPSNNIRLFSLAGLLGAYRPLLEKRSRFFPWDLVLKLEDGGERIRLKGAQILAADSTPGLAELSLSRQAWTRLLFGPCLPDDLPSEWDDHPFIRQALPLPIHWPLLSHI